MKVIPRELSIGNYVHESEYDECFSTYKVAGIEDRGCSLTNIGFSSSLKGMYEWEVIKPIKLTKEWLLKFGFEESQNYFIKPNSGLFFGITLQGFIFPQFDEIQRVPIDLKHVHQLQNLYFTLTGKELTIKDQ